MLDELEEVAVWEGEIHRGDEERVPVVVRDPVTVGVLLTVLLAVAGAEAVCVMLPVEVREAVRLAEAVRVGVPEEAADTVEETEAVPEKVCVSEPDRV
jgi:hypothetical protein